MAVREINPRWSYRRGFFYFALRKLLFYKLYFWSLTNSIS